MASTEKRSSTSPGGTTQTPSCVEPTSSGQETDPNDSEMKLLEKSMGDLEIKVDKAMSRADALKRDNLQLSSKITTVMGTTDHVKLENERLRKSFTELNTDINALKDNIFASKENVDKATNKVTTLEQRVTTLDAKVDKYVERFDSLVVEVDILRKKLTTMQILLDSAIERVNTKIVDTSKTTEHSLPPKYTVVDEGAAKAVDLQSNSRPVKETLDPQWKREAYNIINLSKPTDSMGNVHEWASWFTAYRTLLDDCFEDDFSEALNQTAYELTWYFLKLAIPVHYMKHRPLQGTIAEQADALEEHLKNFDELDGSETDEKYCIVVKTFMDRDLLEKTKDHLRFLFDLYDGRNRSVLHNRLMRICSESLKLEGVYVNQELMAYVKCLRDPDTDVYELGEHMVKHLARFGWKFKHLQEYLQYQVA